MDTEFEDDGEFGFYEAECAGCSSFTRVNDVGLCSDCAGKLERDLIRERDWGHSCLAYGVPADKREQLRQHIVNEHGAALELISPRAATKGQKPNAGSRRRNRRRC